jgi:tetratricopeptide (TPR) repeat protein
VLAAAILPYAPSLRADYVQDDHIAIEANPVVARADWAEIFTSSYWKGTEGDDRSLYRPVTVSSYALERALARGPNAAFAHALNVLLHAAASLLLLRLGFALGAGLPAATAAGTLFAVHPGHSEAVLSLVGRAELLAAIFSLSALLLHAGNLESPSRLRSLGAAVFVFLALGSKEIAIATPALMLAAAVLFRPPGKTSSPAPYGTLAGMLYPTVFALLAHLILRVEALEAFPALQRIHPLDNHLVLARGLDRLEGALAVGSRWIVSLCFPLRLSADYSGFSIPPPRSFFSPPVLGGVLLVGVCLGVALAPAWVRKPSLRVRLASFASLLFLLPYFVVSNLPVNVGAIFAERFTYVPSTGVCLLGGILFELAGEGRLRRLLLGLLVGVGGLLAARTVARAIEWRTDETVFAAAAEAQPGSPRARFVLGKLLADAGNSAEAISRFDEALRLWPEHVPALFEKGVVLGRSGDLEGAEAMFREVLRISPQHGGAHYNLGTTLHLRRELDPAERALRKAVLSEPGHARAWAELGHVRFDRGEFGPAAEAYEQAVRLGRSDLRARLEQARALASVRLGPR